MFGFAGSLLFRCLVGLLLVVFEFWLRDYGVFWIVCCFLCCVFGFIVVLVGCWLFCWLVSCVGCGDFVAVVVGFGCSGY